MKKHECQVKGGKRLGRVLPALLALVVVLAALPLGGGCSSPAAAALDTEITVGDITCKVSSKWVDITSELSEDMRKRGDVFYSIKSPDGKVVGGVYVHSVSVSGTSKATANSKDETEYARDSYQSSFTDTLKKNIEQLDFTATVAGFEKRAVSVSELIGTFDLRDFSDISKDFETLLENSWLPYMAIDDWASFADILVGGKKVHTLRFDFANFGTKVKTEIKFFIFEDKWGEYKDTAHAFIDSIQETPESRAAYEEYLADGGYEAFMAKVEAEAAAKKEQEAVEAAAKKEQEAEAAAQKEAEAAAALAGKVREFSAGMYECGAGKDIEPGTYDVVLVSGSGNCFVGSSPGRGDKLNEIFGSDASWGYIERYSNLKLTAGNFIEIKSGLTLRFEPKK